MSFKIGDLSNFPIASVAIAGATGWWWWWVLCLKVSHALALVGMGCANSDQYQSTYYVM